MSKHQPSAECRERDLACGRSAILLWYGPAAALFLSAPMGDTRWFVWTPALAVMGIACVANAARCGRLHCYITGPVFLIGAALSALHGLDVRLLSLNVISAFVLLGWLAALGLEFVAGSYIARNREAADAARQSQK